MDVDLIFRIAAIGIIVSVLNQVLIRSGREEQATMTTFWLLIVLNLRFRVETLARIARIYRLNFNLTGFILT